MVSTRSKPSIRSYRFASSRRFMMRTAAGIFVVNESMSYREVYVTQASAIDLARPRSSVQALGKFSYNEMIHWRGSPLSIRQFDTFHAVQILRRVVLTDVITGCRREVAHGVRRIRTTRSQQYLVFGCAIFCNDHAAEDNKELTTDSDSSSCDGHYGKRF